MHEWGTGRDNYSIETVFFNVLLNKILAWIRTHVVIFSGKYYIGKFLGEIDNVYHIYGGCDI
jgi:hypothetical protein